MKTYLIITIFILFSFILNCTEKEQPTKNVIATINDRIITQEEFRLFYELDPNFGIDSTGLPALKDEINLYIYQILALKKAEQDKLTSDSIFIRAEKWELRQAMLRELFREDVEGEIKITEAELMQAYMNSNITVHVRHIFAKSKAEIIEYQKELKRGKSFKEISKEAYSDTALAKNGGDLGWFPLADLDPDFATAIMKLKGHEISDIVHTKWGFHLIQLLNYRKQAILNESDFQRRKPSLEKKIFRQKSLELSAKYVKSFLFQQNPQPDKRIFRLIWNELIPTADHEKAILPRKISFSNSSIDKCEAVLESNLNEAFIKYKEGNISLKEFLQEMRAIPLSNRPEFKSARELSNQIGLWVRDKFLLKVAQKKDLDRHPTVMKEVQRFKEEQSYNYYLNENLEQINTPDSIISFFQNINRTRPELARFHTLQEWQWAQAKKQLDAELRKMPARIYIDSLKLAEESRRINWDRRIRMFMVRKAE